MINFMDKKGLSHVEVVLSFIIFLGFSIFLLALFKPFNLSGINTQNLDSLERGVKNYAEINMEKISFLLLNDTSCGIINYSLNNDIVMKNNLGQNIDAYLKAKKDIYFKSGINGDFYFVYSCSEFKNKNFGNRCGELPSSNYSLSVYSSSKIISAKQIENFNKTYWEDYEDLKNTLGINFDFSFGVYDINNNFIYSGKAPAKNANSRTLLIETVYESGEIKLNRLNLRTW